MDSNSPRPSWIAVLLLLLIGSLRAQVPSAKSILETTEADQVKFVTETIDAGFPDERADQMTMLILNRSALVLPLLELRLLAELRSQSPSKAFIETAAEMIAYAGDEHALRALGKLVAIDESKFGNHIRRTLDNSLDRRNPFSVAYAGLQIGDEAVSIRIAEWSERASSSDRMRRLWGEAIAERYVQIPGEAEWRNDPLATRMPDSIRETVKAAVLRYAAQVRSQR